MENSFKSIIDQAKSILILLPTKPFFDQVAAGVSLFLSLRDTKEVQVSCPTPITVEFNRLIGVNKISQELGNKNLIIRFVDYKASDIERVSYDIENSQFRLTVIPKQRILPPSKDQIDLTYSGVSADTIVLVGGVNESHFPAIASKDLSTSAIVHVGTKDLSLSGNRSYSSFSRPASSISEIVASLIKESALKFDEDIATNLLMGIESASNNFSDLSVTAETFATIAELMKSGGKRSSSQVPQTRAYQSFFPQSNFPKPTIPTQQPVSQPITQREDTSSTNPQKEEPPQDWLRPKIFKSTSVS